MNTLPFIIILLINAVVLGVVVGFAVYHARSHFAKKQPAPKTPSNLPILPHDTRQRILDEAEDEYARVLEKTARELEKSLQTTTTKLSAELGKLGGSIISDEIQAYKNDTDHLREEMTRSISNAEVEIATHQNEVRAKLAERQASMERQLTEHESQLSALIKARESRLAEHQARLDADLLKHQQAHEKKRAELESQLEQEIAARREHYLKRIDTNFSETIAAFLTETLGHDVDLGAQKQYLLSVLEEHKEELKKGLE